MGKEKKTETISVNLLGKHIVSRVTKDFKGNALRLCRKYNTTITSLNLYGLIKLFEDEFDLADKTIKKIYNKLKAEWKKNIIIKKNIILRNEIRKKNTEIKHCLFLVKNTSRTIYEQQKNSLVVSRKLNLKSAVIVLDGAKKEIKTYSKAVQNAIKEDFENLNSIRNYESLGDFVNVYKFVEEGADRKKIEYKNKDDKKK